ncbi:MAG: 50S ribosomal protein L10 [Desulfovibrio sp.]|nr:50S ribosomal protein L10 [Desulfovibrio sp.]
MDKSGKAAIIEAFREQSTKAHLACITNFKGMTVEELTNLRVSIHNVGGQYHVIKNTLGRIAVTDTNHDVLKDSFHENTGVALGFDDPVAVAKSLVDFAKGSQLFSLKCASLDGKPMDVAQIEALSKLPGREQLLGQLLGTMNAVPTNFVSLFANIIRGLLYALSAIKEQKEQSQQA